MRPLAARKGAEKRMRDVEDAGEVDGDDVFPILHHGIGRAEHAVAPRDAGIVDQDRDLPDLFGDAFGDRDTVLAPGHIEHEAFRLAAGIANLLRRFGRGLFVLVEQGDLRAFAGVAQRDRATDAGGGTGDNSDMVSEKGHGQVSSIFGFRRSIQTNSNS